MRTAEGSVVQAYDMGEREAPVGIQYLLGEKEYSIIREAFWARKEGLILERSLRNVGSIRISMGVPDKAWSETSWLIRIETFRKNIYSTQYFGSVEELKRYLRG